MVDIDRRYISNSIEMTSEHSTTPANAMTTTTVVARRTSRVALAPTTASFLAMETARAEANKKKRRRISNQLRGENAVEISIASEKKAKSSGEKVKSCVKCCEEAGFLTDNARADLRRTPRTFLPPRRISQIEIGRQCYSLRGRKSSTKELSKVVGSMRA